MGSKILSILWDARQRYRPQTSPYRTDRRRGVTLFSAHWHENGNDVWVQPSFTENSHVPERPDISPPNSVTLRPICEGKGTWEEALQRSRETGAASARRRTILRGLRNIHRPIDSEYQFHRHTGHTLVERPCVGQLADVIYCSSKR